jgi:hypothetical protein
MAEKSLFTPDDLAPRVPADATPAQCIAAWIDLMNACEQFLLAGLRREIGPDGDLRAAYRRWYAERMEEHDRMHEQLAERLNRSGGGRGR